MNQEVLSELLSKADLCKMLSISPRGLEYLVKRNEFPPPVRIGKFVYWSRQAINKWQRRMFSEQEAWEPKFNS
ncbi:MAG TPA: helix-turn-helix domain-containing protein [Methylophilus sp.]|nr:helix-turn-helix domain-containing protein [Methylophilus sp.]HQQ33214.1 helix-turn-helix domain-containing protein [Methylophilus sp.]